MIDKKQNSRILYQIPELKELELLVERGQGQGGSLPDEPGGPAPEQPDDDNDSFGDDIGNALGM